MAVQSRDTTRWSLNIRADDPLDARMAAIQSLAGNAYFDPNGLMQSRWYFHPDTGETRPFRDADFEGQSTRRLPSDQATPAELHHYENTAWISGLFLRSQVLRHKATGDSEALEFARKAFGSIDTIFRMTEATGQRGFLCKPYGGRASHETSPDQYMGVATALWLFRPLTAPAERRRIDDLLPAMADWWRERQYAIPYFGWTFETLASACHRPIMPMLQHMAWRVTGEARYRDEARRLLDLCGSWPTPADVLRERVLATGSAGWPEKLNGHEYDPARRAFLTVDAWRAASLALTPADYFMEEEPSLALLLPHAFSRYLELQRMGLREDLLYHHHIQIDLERNIWRPIRTLPSREDLAKPGMSFDAHLSEVCVGAGPTWLAELGIMAHRHAPGFCPGALSLAQRILSCTENRRLAWFIDPDGHQLLPDQQYRRFMTDDAQVILLLAYWRARAYDVAFD